MPLKSKSNLTLKHLQTEVVLIGFINLSISPCNLNKVIQIILSKYILMNSKLLKSLEY